MLTWQVLQLFFLFIAQFFIISLHLHAHQALQKNTKQRKQQREMEKWRVLRWVSMVGWSLLMASMVASGEKRRLNFQKLNNNIDMTPLKDQFSQLVHFLWQPDQSGYQHVWPVILVYHSLCFYKA